MPFPRTRAVHRKWSEHHRPTATSAMTATCTISAAGTGAGTFDPVTMKTVPPARVTVAAGAKCRVQVQSTAERIVAAGEQVKTLRTYAVGLEHDLPSVQVGYRIVIDTCVDEQLVGRALTVRDVTYGSEQWQRDLICQDDLG